MINKDMFVNAGGDGLGLKQLGEDFWQFLQGNLGKKDENGVFNGYRLVERFYFDSELPALSKKQLIRRFRAAYRGAFIEYCVTVLSMKSHKVNETFNSLTRNEQEQVDNMCLQNFITAGEGLNDEARNRIIKVISSEA